MTASSRTRARGRGAVSSRARLARHGVACASLFVGLLLGACGDEGRSSQPSGEGDAAPATDSATPTRLLRLWLTPPVSEHRPSARDVAGEVVVDARFDGAQTWYRMTSPLPSNGVGLQFEAIRPAKGALGLRSEAGSWGVGALLPVRPGEALSVEITGRGLQPNLHRQRDGSLLDEQGAVDVALLVELRESLDPSRPLTPDEAAALIDRRRHTLHLLEAEQGVFSVRTDLVTDHLTRSLLLVLFAPNVERAGTRVFDSVVVRRRSVSDHVAAGGALPDIVSLDDARVIGSVRAVLDREERRALLAPAPSSWDWELPPTDASRSLSLALGVVSRDESLPGRVRFRVRAWPARDEHGGAREAPPESTEGLLLDEIVEAGVDGSRPAWHDRRVALPACRDVPLRLQLATETLDDDPPVALFGHPTVHTDVGTKRPNVLIVSLDTLRPDRLGCYGGEQDLSPVLDGLAQQGQRFTNAFSTSSYTLPSHGSMLTGQFPAFHGAVNIDDALDPRRSPFLASLLADAGYLTAAFTGGGYVAPSYGFFPGFDRYSVNDPVWAYDSLRGRMKLQSMDWERDPLRMDLLERYGVEMLTGWIREHADDEPFFLFVHTYIVHNYAPDLGALARAGLLQDGPYPERPFDHGARTRFNAGELDLRDEVYAEYMPYYDATIGMADAFVGRLLAALDESGLGEQTLVIVTSDHGEEFGEHGFFGHGETLFEGNTRIPLIVRPPGPASARRASVEEGLVSLVDIAPLVLATVGLPPDPRMAVQPPLGPVRAVPPARAFTVMELDNLHDRISAWRENGLELQVRFGEEGVDFEQETSTLYDLSDADLQVRDASASRGEDAARLRDRLHRFHELAESVHPREGGATNWDEMPEETLRQLLALGYLDGAFVQQILDDRARRAAEEGR